MAEDEPDPDPVAMPDPYPEPPVGEAPAAKPESLLMNPPCLLYTSDTADETPCSKLDCHVITKKKIKHKQCRQHKYNNITEM